MPAVLSSLLAIEPAFASPTRPVERQARDCDLVYERPLTVETDGVDGMFRATYLSDNCWSGATIVEVVDSTGNRLASEFSPAPQPQPPDYTHTSSMARAAAMYDLMRTDAAAFLNEHVRASDLTPCEEGAPDSPDCVALYRRDWFDDVLSSDEQRPLIQVGSGNSIIRYIGYDDKTGQYLPLGYRPVDFPARPIAR